MVNMSCDLHVIITLMYSYLNAFDSCDCNTMPFIRRMDVSGVMPYSDNTYHTDRRHVLVKEDHWRWLV